MRTVDMKYEGQKLVVVIRDDHPALVYLRDKIIATIWPFHSERQHSDIVAETVKEYLVANDVQLLR